MDYNAILSVARVENKTILIALFFSHILHLVHQEILLFLPSKCAYNLTTSQYLHYHYPGLCHHNLLPNWSSCFHTYVPTVFSQHNSENDPFNSKIMLFLFKLPSDFLVHPV